MAYHFKATEPLQQFTIAVLQPMGLVDDCNPPVNSTQFLQVRDDHFVGCYQSMEFVYIWYSITLQHAFHNLSHSCLWHWQMTKLQTCPNKTNIHYASRLGTFHFPL